MDIHLRLQVVPDDGVPMSADVTVNLEISHTVQALVDAVLGVFGAGTGPGIRWHLSRAGEGGLLDPTASVADVGLVSGETLVVSARPPTSGSTSRSVQGLVAGPELVVRSGPDVGSRVALGQGSMWLGRDAGCWFTLRDPNVAREHVRLESVGPEDNGNDSVATGLRPDTAFPRFRVFPAAEAPVEIDGERIGPGATFGVGQLLRMGASTLALHGASRPSRRHRRDAEDVNFGDIGFHRTPYYPTPVPEVTFEPLNEVPEKPESNPFAYLALMMPLLFGIGMALLLGQPRFLVFAVFSPLAVVASFFDRRRSGRRRRGQSFERYERRAKERKAELRRALALERQRRFLGAPDLAALAARARDRTVELWVRDRDAPDVLQLRLGLGDTEPQLVVKPETRGDEVLRDELAEELAALVVMPDVPVTVDLVEVGVLGLVGRGIDTSELAASLVVQACCLHSPEDLIVVAAVAPERDMGAWLQWLPHQRSPNSPLAGAHRATTRSGVEDLVKELLVVAQDRLSGTDRKVDRRWPRLLVTIDRSLDPDPALVSRLLDVAPGAGMTVLWLTASLDRVPRQAPVVVHCSRLLSPSSSTLVFSDPNTDEQSLEIDRLSTPQAVVIAQSLAPLRDASSATATSAVPRLVTLHHALGVDEIDGNWVAAQWAVDRGYHLPTPIGLTANGPLVLDLVEHGPHGLIGGTSGAGKSELVMSLVAGLMALNRPDRVNFLFIDYKGGASSAAFVDAPHTVGCVTNLDAMLARRALVSLGAELNRRMDLLQGKAKDLAEMLANHPNEAPPSLVIVIDEFATLVKEVPEFVAGVVDLAQRGRSLGIHLLLATQRPSGAVNENILANTNLRISLRMLDSGESMSVIGTADAAAIPTPLKGRGYARLGPGELVPFQTAWSGAPLVTSSGPEPVGISPLGAAPRRPDAADVGGDGAPSVDTQVDRLLASVEVAAARSGFGRGPSPWLDELPEQLSLDALRRQYTSPSASAIASGQVRPLPRRRGLVVEVGLVDDPQAQAQYPAVVDFEAAGGLIILGAGGSGKTTALQTLAVAAAIDDAASHRSVVDPVAASQRRPGARNGAGGGAGSGDGNKSGGGLTMFGLDFASRRLTSLAALPQCAAMATGDDLEAVTRVIVVLENELARRRSLNAAAGRSGDEAPWFDPILLLIDDYGGLGQTFQGAGVSTALYPWLDRLNQVIVDGRQVGVHTALTANRRGAIRSGVMSAISERYVLRQSEATAYGDLGISPSLVGDVELPPGRCFVAGQMLAQLAIVDSSGQSTPGGRPSGTADGDDQQRTIRNVATELGVGIQPGLRTEALPREVVFEAPTVLRAPSPGAGRLGGVRLGLADLTNDVVELDLSTSDLTILGDPRSGRSTALATMAAELGAAGLEVWTMGPAHSPLAGVAVARCLFGPLADLVVAIKELSAALTDRPEGSPTPVLLVDDVDLLEDPSLDGPMGALLGSGLRWVAATTSLRGYSTSPLVQAMKKARSLLYLQPPSGREVQEVSGAPTMVRPGLAMPPGRGILVANRQPLAIQVANHFARRSDSVAPTDAPVATLLGTRA